jgi:hypothetical protein
MSFVESDKQEGAKVLTGGERHGKTGYYIEPVRDLTLPGCPSDLVDDLWRRHEQHEDCPRGDLWSSRRHDPI